MFAYLDSARNVIALSKVERTLVQAKGVNPQIETIIANAPDNLRYKPYIILPSNKFLNYHQLIQGQSGTDISHYIEVDFLNCYKKFRFIEITKRTEQLLQDGFNHDSHEFTLNIEFRNHLGMLADLALEGVLNYPERVICKSEFSTYEIANGVSLKSLYIAMAQAYKIIMTGDVLLKKQIIDAVNKTAIDAVVDNR